MQISKTEPQQAHLPAGNFRKPQRTTIGREGQQRMTEKTKRNPRGAEGESMKYQVIFFLLND